jgi:serine/threonine protein kinase
MNPRYVIEKEVGRGTFGRVLRCVDKKPPSPENATVAIKVESTTTSLPSCAIQAAAKMPVDFGEI